MATTKSRTTRRTTRARTSTPRSTTSSGNSSRKQSFTARTGKAISDRPVASAAIGTGLVAGIAAAVAGFFAFKKSGKSFSEFSDDVSSRVKDGLADAGTRAKDFTSRRKDGIDVDRPQTEFSEEALTLKETGKRTKGKRPVDPVIEDQSKVGAISY